MKAADLAATGGSALVGFQQAGAGAVARTAQSKLREIVSVKDFGAVGDGVVNDTAAFQAAHDALPASGGAIIVPSFDYALGGTVIITKPIDFIIQPGAKFIATAATGDLFLVRGLVTGFKMVGAYFTASVVRTGGYAINLAGSPAFGTIIHPVVSFNYFEKQYRCVAVDYAQHPIITHNTVFDSTSHAQSAGSGGVFVGTTHYVHGADVSGNHFQVSDALGKAFCAIHVGHCDVYFIERNTSVRYLRCLIIKPVGASQYAGVGRVIGNNFDTSEIGVLIEPESGGRVLTTIVAMNWLCAASLGGLFANDNTGKIRDLKIFNNEMKYGFDSTGVVTEVNGIDCVGNGQFDGLRIYGNTITNNSGAAINLSGTITHVTTSRNIIEPEVDEAGYITTNKYGLVIGAGVSGQSVGDTVTGCSTFDISNPGSSFLISGLLPANWKNFSTSIAPQGGAFTAGIDVARYRQDGKTVYVHVDATISSGGTASGYIAIPMPVASRRDSAGSGWSTSGNALQARVIGSELRLLKYDGTTAAVASSVVVDICYEAA